MKYPKIKSAQGIVNLLQQKGVKDIIISPGSRNAPLTIGFTENSFFNTYSIVDERSAAFFALGISQQTNKTSVLVCTSGSALLNYYPAVAEAFYSNIPLIIISADRPIEWINQADGQTINQNNALSNHVLKSVTLADITDETSQWYNGRLLNEAINIAEQKKGPVHINVPFEEPLYETVSKNVIEHKNILIPKIRPQLEIDELQKYADIWSNSTRKIVLVGSHKPDEQLQIQLNHLAKDPSVLIFTETISNMYGENFISNIDQLITNISEENTEKLKPQVLITLGGMLISKRIKAFLRTCNMYHWHIGNDIVAADTYKNLTTIFRVDTDMFFSQFFFLKKNVESNYRDFFLNIRDKRKKKHDDIMSKLEFSDLKVYDILMDIIPAKTQIQSSNSSVIRYLQLFDRKYGQEMFCNRGTSGIEGSTSTAIGVSIYSKKPVVFITGDISFFYDSNALWNNYIPENFKIIIVNNGGGSIFKIIQDSSISSQFNRFFKAEHELNAEKLAHNFGFKYIRVDAKKDLEKSLYGFIDDNSLPSILEVNTSKIDNEKILKEYWSVISSVC